MLLTIHGGVQIPVQSSCRANPALKFPVRDEEQLSQKYPVTELPIEINPPKAPVRDLCSAAVQQSVKFPVFQEDMAVHIGQSCPNVFPVHHVFADCLYDSMNKMVYKLCHKYTATCPDETVDDLANRCWYRIIYKMDKFDPKWRFSTWCWHVCQSTLNKHYWRLKKYHDRFGTPTDGTEKNRPSKEDVHSDILGDEFHSAIKELEMKYPDQAELIRAMFGGFNGEGLPTRVNLRSVSKKTGVKEHRVSSFYHQIVKPFFKTKFKEEQCYG